MQVASTMSQPGNRQRDGKEVALLVYPFLVALAQNRKTLRYGALAKQVGWGGARTIDYALRWIMFWCHYNGLPPLTCVIVDVKGFPGPGLITVGAGEGPQLAAREQTFSYPWEAVAPPTLDELEAARSTQTLRRNRSGRSAR